MTGKVRLNTQKLIVCLYSVDLYLLKDNSLLLIVSKESYLSMLGVVT